MKNTNITIIFATDFLTKQIIIKQGTKIQLFLMLYKSHRQLIRQLQQKKFRNEKKRFIVEGKKSIQEFLQSDFKLDILFYTNIFWQNDFSISEDKKIKISSEELQSISSLKTPDEGVAIFHIPEDKPLKMNGIIVALDDIRDPGNLGTIIRLCDWFGVKQVVCSEASVDCFNPKVVQATMGSLTRVCVFYTDLQKFLQMVSLPIYGAVLNGENIYKTQLPQEAILVLGNEANGISHEVQQLCNHKITIPQQGENQTESLNVAMASAILLNEFHRNGL